VYNIFSV